MLYLSLLQALVHAGLNLLT